MQNPLLDDRTVDFLLYEVFDVERLSDLPAFREHSRDTFDPYLLSCRKLAREHLFPTYRAIDEAPPRFEGGRVTVHPLLRELYPKMAALGLLNATRPEAVGGQHLPVVVASLANAYLMAANLSAYAYAGLTASAARLIESFGSDALRAEFMDRMYSGEWTGTMALTEPQAGSSLSDVKTRATPTGGAHHSIRGSKIFISGGDQDMTVVVAWMWLLQSVVARRALTGGTTEPGFYEGKLCAAQYFILTELPKVHLLAALCRSGEDSYARVQPSWL